MIELIVNGRAHRVDADPAKPLLWVLRDQLGLKGTKYGCGVGLCGSCLVLLDGEPNHACMVPVGRVGARSVTTIEGMPAEHPVVAHWIAAQVPQCGYCQPAQVLGAAALLAKHPVPTRAEVDAAMSGVLCRCGTYQRIRHAIEAAAGPVAASAPPVDLPDLASELPVDAGVALNEWIRVNAANVVTLTINHSEMGQGALTGLVAVFAEELDVDVASVRTVFAPPAACYANGLWGEQFTGGSSSIRGEWQRFRESAAKARLRLVRAAARRWDARVGDLRTEHGHVVDAATARRASYGELAEAAIRLVEPKRFRLKDPAAFRLIGTALPRLDIPAMTRGRTRYGIDVAVPGALVATVVRCPVFGGRPRRHDAAAALAVAGVRHVVPVSGGIAVVADDFWSAIRGREALHVEWRLGPHANLDSAAIEARLLAALAKKGTVASERGDAPRALRGSAAVVDAVYATPYVAHATIEPMNCVAHVRGGACDVWVGTQHQEDTQKVAARIAGVPKSKVTVHTQFLGGGFGRRLDTDFVADAVELSKALGVPVQVIWTRADDLQHDGYRPAHAARLAACLDERGFPLAWQMRIAGPDLALEGIHVPYAIPNLREEHARVDAGIPTGPWRSVGASNNAFAIECFVDELAHRAGQDPLRYRLALLGDAPRHAAVLREAAARAGWDTPPGAGRGRGVAIYKCFGSVVADVAEVSVAGGAIRVDRVVSVIDCGIAVVPDAVRAQLEGAVAFGLSAALKEEIRIAGGRVLQGSFADYPILTLAEMPRVEVHILPSAAAPGGVGEPGVPVIAPAVANAVFAATGQRLRRLPLRLPA
jgi:isoquinoline 1-oxidoreductase beta subunit